MKKFFKIIVCILLIALLGVFVFGCKKKVRSDEPYYAYTYDTKTDRFVKMGAFLTFGENMESFTYSFGNDDLTIYGNVEKVKIPDSYVVSCNDQVAPMITERYRQSLIDAGASQSTLDLLDALSATFTPRAQYFAYGGKLFTADAVELYHVADKDSDSFEGLFHMDGSEDLARFRGGYMYIADENGEYTIKSGRYTASRGFLTLVSLNKDGTDRYENGMLYRKRYFMAKVTIPQGDSLVGTTMEELILSSPFASEINENMAEYSGKTVTVLAETFFSLEM